MQPVWLFWCLLLINSGCELVACAGVFAKEANAWAPDSQCLVFVPFPYALTPLGLQLLVES